MPTHRVPSRHFQTVDLRSPALHVADGLAGTWRDLRREEPVAWHQPAAAQSGFWAVSRHGDVLAVLRDTDTFSSAGGTMLSTLTGGGDSGAGKMLVVSDGRWHKELKRLLTSGFGPRVLKNVQATIEAAAVRLIRAALERGACDFAEDVAAQLPLTAICDLLGVPEDDRAEVLSLTNAAMLTDDDDSPSMEARLARSEIFRYYVGLAASRRDAPEDDVVTLLATGVVDGRRLTDEEVLLNCYNLVIGGDETARLAMSGGLLALLQNPAQLVRLRAEPGLIEPAVEEILRWTTPASHIGRTVVADTEVAGVPMAAGDVVTLWLKSANRDESVFDRPEAFDIGRSPNKHATFGHGQHFCLGAHLSRVEIRALLRTLVDEVADIRLTGEPAYQESNFLNGVNSLPVAFTR